MKATHYAITGFGFVILNEYNRSNLLVEILLGEGFEEVAARIFKDSGFQN